MLSLRKKQIYELLKGIETGDASSVAIINPDKYIQHNPQTHEGREGLAALFKRLSKSNPRVNIVRIFEDGNYVFAHTEYDFDSSRIGFEVFRFENDQVVEHWDNIQLKQGPNPSGHSMVGGRTEISDIELTEFNRKLVHSFIEDIFIDRQYQRLEKYINQERFTQHNPWMSDDLSELRLTLEGIHTTGNILKYKQIHRVLAEGDFVLVASEGFLNGIHSAFYDLFHVDEAKLTEHWGTIETIPCHRDWKNDNGKF